MSGFKQPKRHNWRLTYIILTVLAFAMVLGTCSFAKAQSTAGNTIRMGWLCVKQSKDPLGCALLQSGNGPFSVIRHMSAKLYAAQTEADTPADRSTAQTLFTAWKEELELHRTVQGRLGFNNAGVLLERAWITRLEECEKSPCPMLKNTGLLNRSKVFLTRIYREDRKAWDKLGEAEKLLGRGI